MHFSLASLSAAAMLLATFATAKRPTHAGKAVTRRRDNTFAATSATLQSRGSGHRPAHAKRKKKRSSSLSPQKPRTPRRAPSSHTASIPKKKKKKKSCRRRSAAVANPKSSSAYSLVQHSAGGYNFFDNWDFFTHTDPTHGAVSYVDGDTAWKNGLVYVPGGAQNSTVLRVDSWSNLTYGENRQSVRITSKEKVKFGSMVVIDLERIPYGPTVWPALWTVGDNWPLGGEIDIVEGVHDSKQNQMTLHTAPGCMLASPLQAVGSVLTTNCDAYVASNTGCGIQDPSTSSFGSAFNAQGGGIYVMNWDEEGIAVYFFPRGSIPSDLTSESPDPSSWGPPRARWDASTCSPSQFFGDQTIVINITIGGDWAGSTYNAAGYAGDWRAAVMNPANYAGAAFEVNYVKVFKKQ
ncbi:hypothetical protein JCM10213_004783 [Rhodosporidiobolus nylandii]